MNRWLAPCVALIVTPLMAATCESLSSLELPEATITKAQVVTAGGFTLPGAPANTPYLGYLKSWPSFCRVEGVIAPSSDSHIEFETWLPISGWNGAYFGIGNGGLAGSIEYLNGPAGNVPGMAEALLGGFATSSTDTGHRAADAHWALGHPEKIVDYGYRAIHETAIKSQLLIRAFYGQGPKHSYFISCSTGGREALMEAQRFPLDYDGIIAGAPVGYLTRIIDAYTMNMQATEGNPASYIPASKLRAIDAAVLGSCDELDGLKDGIIADPMRCHFDPQTLLCRETESETCLTQAQVDAVRKIYVGPRTSKGDQIFPGLLPGSGWSGWIMGARPGTSAQYQYATRVGADLIFQKSDWDYRTFNPDRDVKIADDTMGQRLNAINPNLKAFKNRGGKLILYHGWSDAAVAPQSTVEYFEAVNSKMGRKNTESFTRLYMVPGMGHCGGGPGPNTFRLPIESALENWVEKGIAPGPLTATKYMNDANPTSGVVRTRPLCPYPQSARYNGTGSINDAANFTCVAPKQ